MLPLLEEGWTVAVTLTQTATEWLARTGKVAELERATGLPVRWPTRPPAEERPHPRRQVRRRAGVHLVYRNDAWPLHAPTTMTSSGRSSSTWVGAARTTRVRLAEDGLGSLRAVWHR